MANSAGEVSNTGGAYRELAVGVVKTAKKPPGQKDTLRVKFKWSAGYCALNARRPDRRGRSSAPAARFTEVDASGKLSCVRLFKPALSLPDPHFVIEDFEPVYLQTWREGLLERKVQAALQELEECEVCPRDCRINRLKDEQRVCHTGRFAIVSSAFPHFGEEDCLRGWNGSGTIFFGLCNLRCVFCQNWDISQKETGREMKPDDIADLALQLQDVGVGEIARDGKPRYQEIGRRPSDREMTDAYQAARSAGLSRLDARV